MKKDQSPQSAIISITSQCNSRCLLCDIWKRKGSFINPEILKKLPKNLEDIDVTGGEPFLHPKLLQIIKILGRDHRSARFLITTNGLLPEKIAKITPDLIKEHKNIAFRISLDGIDEAHNRIRGVKNAFGQALKTIKILKELKIKDLGIIFVLSRLNASELPKVLNFCRKEKLQFSLNLVCDSPIYFGKDHSFLKANQLEVKKNLQLVRNFLLPSFNPKNWGKVWFYQKLFDYSQSGRRCLRCGAGKEFFYLQPDGNIYLCHLKNWKIGNLQRQSFGQIWRGRLRERQLQKTANCHSCFMVCTVKQEVRRRKFQVIKQLFWLDR